MKVKRTDEISSIQSNGKANDIKLSLVFNEGAFLRKYFA
jgi:hypothetical protein